MSPIWTTTPSTALQERPAVLELAKVLLEQVLVTRKPPLPVAFFLLPAGAVEAEALHDAGLVGLGGEGDLGPHRRELLEGQSRRMGAHGRRRQRGGPERGGRRHDRRDRGT